MPYPVRQTAAEAAVHPILASLLIHGYRPPRLVLVVEAIDHVQIPGSNLSSARLLLGDGQLCIQALLIARIQFLVAPGQIDTGAIVEVARYDVVANEGGAEGKVGVCLEVGWVEVVGRWFGGRRRDGEEESRLPAEEDHGYDSRRDLGVAEYQNMMDSFSGVQFNESFFRPLTPDVPNILDTLLNPLNPHTEIPPTSSPLPPSTHPLPAPLPTYKPLLSSLPPTTLFRNWTPSRTTPLKLTPLSHLPFLPYKFNWSCSVLCIITFLGPVEPAQLAPLQRVCRIVDPTAHREVRLTVFLDPKGFTPMVGEPLLLGGVKNHTYEGGSLNKYESDKPNGGKWWWTGEELKEFEWCNVDQLWTWWKGKTESIETES